VTTLSHLSPDVLEVVRDVARQEDSFLLRVQSVPLRDFTDGRVTPLRSTGTYLSSAERHLLDACRDDVALSIEIALYEEVARAPHTAKSIVNGTLVSSQILRTGRVSDRASVGAASWLEKHGLAQSLAKRADVASSASWRELARVAMALRIRQSTRANVAFGFLGEHALGDATRVGVQLRDQGYGDPDFISSLGLCSFAQRRFDSAARSYAWSWCETGRVRFLAPAILNEWLAHRRVSRNLIQAADEHENLLRIELGQLRAAMQAPINAESTPVVVAQLRERRVVDDGPLEWILEALS